MRAKASTPDSPDGFTTLSLDPSTPTSLEPTVRAPPSRVGAPIDIDQPFDARAEADAIYRALRGEKNHWSGVNELATRASRLRLAEELHAAAREFIPAHADEAFVRAYATILAARAQMPKHVRDYLRNLKPAELRGLILHGFVSDIAVPEGKTSATFDDLKAFLPLLQGRGPARNAATRALRWLQCSLEERYPQMLRLEAALDKALAHLGLKLRLRDYGLGFSRLMLTPFAAEDGKDGGYSQIDPRKVDDRYGGNEAHARFMKAANERGIEVISDRVGNHNSKQHVRTQALLAGDFDQLAQHHNWSGAARVGAIVRDDGRTFNLLVHTGDSVGAASQAWVIFPHANPDTLVRVEIPVKGEWAADLDKLQRAVGPAFALDKTAQQQVRAIFESFKDQVTTDEKGRAFLPQAAQEQLITVRERNNARTLDRLRQAIAAGREPKLTVDLFASFMADVQYDKNLSHPLVLQEELDAHAAAAKVGQSGIREDAIIHAFKEPGTDQLNLPQSRAYMRYMALVVGQMMPGAVTIPEAFLPSDQIREQWLEPHLDIDGQRYPLMGTDAISFQAAITLTRSLLTADARPYADYVGSATPKPGQHGRGVAYPVRLHDEALLDAELRAQKEREGKLIDPFVGLEGSPTEEEVAVALRQKLADGEWFDFAGRAAGNDGATVLGSAQNVALGLALIAAGPDTGAVSYHMLAGVGDDPDFALRKMHDRLGGARPGSAAGFRAAFDDRDLGRGPVAWSTWEAFARTKEGGRVSAINHLLEHHAAAAVPTGQRLVAPDGAWMGFARRSPDGKKALLQLHNVTDQHQVVRLKTAELADMLGWKPTAPGVLRDVLNSRIEERTVRLPYRMVGDEVELELAPKSIAWVEPSKPGALDRLLRQRANAQAA